MKIVFVNQASNIFTFHQGIAALSAYIKENSHHEVGLIDFLGKVQPNYFKHQLERETPDVIAFSVMSVYWSLVKQMATLAKEVTDVPIICGGYHPTFAPEEVIAHPSIDALCRGEGEEALLEFLNALESGDDYTHIKNLWIKSDGKIIKNDVRPLIQDLDKLPFWDRELFNVDKWFGKTSGTIMDMYKPERVITVASGRGCYFNCTYCSNKAMQEMYRKKGRYVRIRSVDNLLAEMRILKERFEPDYFEAEEELFATNKEWLEEFAEKYPREIGVPLRISYRVELATEKNLALLKKAGCVSIAYGVECGNEAYRKKYLNRKMTNQQLIDAFQRTRAAGIKTLSFNMIALPHETYDHIQETIELNRRLKPDFLQWYIFQPYPGTVLYEHCKENDLLLDKQISSYASQKSQIKLTDISPDEFRQCVRDLLDLQTELQGYSWREMLANQKRKPTQIRVYENDDEYQIVDLYNEVFKKERTMAHWCWEFAENPAGIQISVAETARGEIVGHYAGLPTFFNYDGEKILNTQIIDSMVAPDYQKALKKPGLFAKCVIHGGDTFGQRYHFAYGFPNKVHYRLGTTQHVKYTYEKIRNINKLVKNIEVQKSGLMDKFRNKMDKLNYTVAQIDRFDERADALWERCKEDLPLAIIRNAEYLNWRYIDCPDVNYLCIGVYHKKSGYLLGWAVLRLNWMTDDATGLVDWLVPREDKKVAEILRRNLEHSAKVGGTKTVEAWFPPYSDEYQWLLDNGYHEEKTKSVLVAHIFKPDLIDYEFINTKWYYTMGDSDVY
jgi:radical SAM superfamily enzyme YgiQ (UPF0313 family)